MHQQVKDMPPAQFKEVLEELMAEFEGQLGALKDEEEG